jgi:hypothetical protein
MQGADIRAHILQLLCNSLTYASARFDLRLDNKLSR